MLRAAPLALSPLTLSPPALSPLFVPAGLAPARPGGDVGEELESGLQLLGFSCWDTSDFADASIALGDSVNDRVVCSAMPRK